MKLYKVISKFYDNGTVTAEIYNDNGFDCKPLNTVDYEKEFDVYTDYFTDLRKAFKYYKECLNLQ